MATSSRKKSNQPIVDRQPLRFHAMNPSTKMMSTNAMAATTERGVWVKTNSLEAGIMRVLN
jgi:hypothetical protein